MPKALLMLAALFALQASFSSNALEDKFSIAQNSHKNLTELKSEINWFIESQKKRLKENTTLYQKTGDLEAVTKRNVELIKQLALIDQHFSTLRQSLSKAIELARGKAPYTDLVELCALDSLITSYRNIIEEGLFPQDWKAEYKASSKQEDKS